MMKITWLCSDLQELEQLPLNLGIEFYDFTTPGYILVTGINLQNKCYILTVHKIGLCHAIDLLVMITVLCVCNTVYCVTDYWL